jgi:hypothetical protein
VTSLSAGAVARRLPRSNHQPFQESPSWPRNSLPSPRARGFVVAFTEKVKQGDKIVSASSSTTRRTATIELTPESCCSTRTSSSRSDEGRSGRLPRKAARQVRPAGRAAPASTRRRRSPQAAAAAVKATLDALGIDAASLKARGRRSRRPRPDVITENLGTFLQDFGVPVLCGAYTFTGVLDAPDETLNMGGVNVLSTMYVAARADERRRRRRHRQSGSRSPSTARPSPCATCCRNGRRRLLRSHPFQVGGFAMSGSPRPTVSRPGTPCAPTTAPPKGRAGDRVGDDVAADHIRAGRIEPTPVDKPAAPGAANAGDAADRAVSSCASSPGARRAGPAEREHGSVGLPLARGLDHARDVAGDRRDAEGQRGLEDGDRCEQEPLRVRPRALRARRSVGLSSPIRSTSPRTRRSWATRRSPAWSRPARVGEEFEAQEADRTAGTLTVRYRGTFLTSRRAIDKAG